MNTETHSRQVEALCVAQNIEMRLRQIVNGEWADSRTAAEYDDIFRTLHDIENRLYCRGEYAPANSASMREAR